MMLKWYVLYSRNKYIRYKVSFIYSNITHLYKYFIEGFETELIVYMFTDDNGNQTTYLTYLRTGISESPEVTWIFSKKKQR